MWTWGRHAELHTDCYLIHVPCSLIVLITVVVWMMLVMVVSPSMSVGLPTMPFPVGCGCFFVKSTLGDCSAFGEALCCPVLNGLEAGTTRPPKTSTLPSILLLFGLFWPVEISLPGLVGLAVVMTVVAMSEKAGASS